MKLTVNTETLQRLVSKVIKGASNNKLLSLTSFINISLNNGQLRLDTTDMTNYTSVIETGIDGENFEVVVEIDSFSKIVGKTTSETITLELKDNSLIFTGNGTYNIELPLNEEGERIKFPMYDFVPNSDVAEIDISDIRSIINSNKACLAVENTVPSLMYYYCGDNVISADQNNICINSISLFTEPLLISSVMMNLVSMFTEDKIYVQLSDNGFIKFFSNNYIVYGRLYNQVEDYPAEPIEAYLTLPFTYNCKFNKELLLGALDRLIIFTDKLDDNILNLKFNKNSVTIFNKNNTSYETVNYLNIIESDENINYTCAIKYDLFKNQIVSNSTDIINLSFGVEGDTCIKIVDTQEDNTITKITSLQEI